MVNTLPRKSLRALVFLIIIGFPPLARADKLEDAVRALANRIVPMMSGNQSPCVDWENQNAISDMRSIGLRSMFIGQLGIKQSAAGVDTQNCPIDVVLDRTPTQIVLIVAIGSGEQKHVFMSGVSRSDVSGGAVTSSSAQLQKELLIQLPERILDALEIAGKNGEASSLVVLTRDTVAIYQPDSDGWKRKSSRQLPVSNVVQRAPQGELQWDAGSPDALKILLPGQSCTMSMLPNGALNCQSGAVSWRSGSVPAPPCGQEPGVLETDSKDWSETDRILLVNPTLPKDQVPLAGIGLPGPVLSLAPGNVPGVLTAVAFNLSTGNYEVYRITLVCGS